MNVLFQFNKIDNSKMQTQSRSEYLKACTEYFQTLNKVNLLLVKQHTFLSEKQQYEQEISLIDQYIHELQNQSNPGVPLSVEKEHEYLQEVIRQNKVELLTLNRKLGTKDSLIKELNALKSTQEKYLKLLSSDYQSHLQQKLSMIRGKVDDLKKKIKEINKDILSLEQEHKQFMDDYSYRCNCLKDYKEKNESIRKEIETIKAKISQAKRR